MLEKMKILLLAVYNDQVKDNVEEIGICYIASYLRKHGYEVMIMGSHEKRINYDKIVEFKPGIIGLPVYDNSKESVYKVCLKLKKCVEKSLIVVGGVSPTYHSIEMMQEASFIDFAIRGEGERTFLQMLNSIENGLNFDKVKGLVYRDGDSIILNEEQDLIDNINELPLPARDLLVDNKLQIAQISTSRGCTRNCNFCSSKSFWKRWRGRNINEVVDEIEYLVKNYNIKKFNFIDCSFEDPGTNYERVMKIAEEIVKRDMEISYYVDLRAEFQRGASHELLEMLRRSGLCGVFCGIEAANEEDLSLYGKVATVEDNNKIVKVLKEYDIHLDIGFITFNPYSTFDRLRKNIDYLETNGFACNFAYLRNEYRLYKETNLFLKIQNDGLIKEGQYDNSYNYEYANKDIEKVITFIKNHFALLDKETNNACNSRIYMYKFYHLPILNYLKRRLKSEEYSQAYDYVTENERITNEILTELNERNACWFRRLLDIGKAGWDENAAIQVMNEFLSKEYLKGICAQLDCSRAKLYKKMLKFNLADELIF